MPIHFNVGNEQYAWLSSYFPSPIKDKKGRTWRTAEHAYQACKTIVPEEMQYIYDAPNGKIAKERGKAATLRPEWNNDMAIQIMTRVLRQKFTQHDELREKLLSTGTEELIFHAPWDDFWGSGPQNKGRNWLGILIMALRTELQEETTNA